MRTCAADYTRRNDYEAVMTHSPLRRTTGMLLAALSALAVSASSAPAQTPAAPPAAAPAEDTKVDAKPAAPAGPPQISWAVYNPFRFFLDPADTEIHRATYNDLSDEDRRNPVLAAERALASRHPEGWAATMVAKTCWDQKKNRYACKDGKPYVTPDSHTVVLRMENAPDAAAECQWLTSPLGSKAGRGKAVKKACSEPVSLEIPFPNGATVAVEIGGNQVAATPVKVTDLLVVGMGDSFGSGEGNPDVPVRFSRERAMDYGKAAKAGNIPTGNELTGYPARVGEWGKIGDGKFIEENARWIDQACHRSLYSQQLRAALQLAVEAPHRSVTYVGVACSGAEITQGLFLTYRGNEWVPNPPDLSQISAVAEAQCGGQPTSVQDLPEAYHMNGKVPELQGGLTLRKCDAEHARKIDLVFLSIGGNDVGFSRLVANAVISDQSSLKKLGGWFGQVHGPEQAKAQLIALSDRYKALNRAMHNILHIPWDQTDRVIVTGYPGLALLEDGKSVCPDGRAGMDVVADFELSQAKARDSGVVADKLHGIMRASAKAHSWSFAEAHRKGFLGRGLCAGYTDNALSTADDLRMPRKIDGEWVPYNPADYQPYASRQRWFRTPNDAFLTGNFHTAPSLATKVVSLQTLSWFQLLLASTYSGAFHPNAEGHAAIADGVAEKARAVLAKYGQGPKPGQENAD
jgi:lysophospholipase L1-like esterase